MSGLRIILALLAFLPPLAAAFQNEPEGFRGMTWKQPPNGEFELLNQSKHSAYYERRNDKNTIGGAKNLLIIYVFYKNQFSSVMISSKGLDNKLAMSAALRHNFGEPEQIHRHHYRYRWDGEKTTIMIDCDLLDDCRTFFQSTELMQAEMTDNKKEAEKSAGDF